MHAANSSGIQIWGATYANISCPGLGTSTNQCIYISDSVSKMYICREASELLGLVVLNLPETGSTVPCPLTRLVHHGRRSLSTCLSWCRAQRSLLGEWLLNHYKSSAFNNCEHQPLPAMSVPDLELRISKDAIPRSHHKARMVYPYSTRKR